MKSNYVTLCSIVAITLLSSSWAYRDVSRIFGEKVDVIIDIEGRVNGERFRVEGKGYGNARTGFYSGKFTIVDGELPATWSVFASTLQAGFECFSKYPEGLNDWRDYLKKSFPDGYTAERKVYFENDGVARVRQRVNYERGTIHSSIKLDGEGFRRNGYIMSNDILDVLPSVSQQVSEGRGRAKSAGYFVFPVRDSDEYQVARHETHYRARGEYQQSRSSRLIPYHLTRFNVKQYRDSRDRRNHIIQEGVLEAYEMRQERRYDDLLLAAKSDNNEKKNQDNVKA